MRRDGGDMELALEAPARLPAVPLPSEALSPTATDGELLVRIADRDREAFELLYHRYIRPIFGFALRRLRDRPRAEDAVQETFAAIWRSAGSYRPERGAAAPWLYAVARNAVIDRMRVRQEPPGQRPDLPSLAPGPADKDQAPASTLQVPRPR